MGVQIVVCWLKVFFDMGVQIVEIVVKFNMYVVWGVIGRSM